ncbi:ABC transporter substrate-binding protein [bacterium]|nr:MAG: ABC transporter substrate-binding protein [bacterium]
MNKVFWIRFFDSRSGDNRKSKTCPELSRRIQNLKWAGFLAILVLLVGHVGMAEAQQPKKVPRIGILAAQSPSAFSTQNEALRKGLAGLGYTEGKNIALEYRYAEGQLERLPDLAAELVRLKVDLIVAGGLPAARAAKQTTTTIPIVMQGGDPVATGLVASLARPGGNVTGLSDATVGVSTKRLELLKEVVPKVSRVAMLWNPANPTNPIQVKDTQDVAPALGMTVYSVEVKGVDDFDRAFAAIKRDRAGALLVPGDPMFATHRQRILDFAVKSRLPSMGATPAHAEDGGLMAYGTNFADLYRRIAIYVDKILKGAKAADLPIEQPMKLELIINLKAAKQIGLTIPPNVLARADKVIK